MAISGLTAIVPNNYPFNDRILQDGNFIATGTLPGSATTTNTGVLDLQVSTPYPTTEVINVAVGYGASANGNTTANGVCYLRHSADNSNWSNIPTLGTVPLVAAATIAANSYTFKLPPGCYRYIMARFTWGYADNLSDSATYLRLLF